MSKQHQTQTQAQQHNGRMAAQLDDVRYCLADLARRGARIVAVEIGVLPRPRITCARAVRGLKGGCIRIVGGARRTETYAAPHMECQIEWSQTA